MTAQFPTVYWGAAEVTFVPCEDIAAASEPGTAALVIAFDGPSIVLAEIVDRGWCVPGGRIEPGETQEGAARREAFEEAGLELGPLEPLGTTCARDGDGSWRPLAVTFLAEVTGRAQLPSGSESLGVCLVSRSEARSRYYMWDALIEAIFNYAWDRRSERVPVSSGGLTVSPST